MGREDRQKMLKQLENVNIDLLPPCDVVKAMLIAAGARADAAEKTAERILNRFGSLAAVFDAPPDELMAISGVSENAAVLIKLVPQISRRCLVSKKGRALVIDSPEKAGEYLLPYFYGETKEVFYMLTLDERKRAIDCHRMFVGDLNSASLNLRELVSTAMGDRAAYAIAAHNHPSGFAIPSRDDETATKRIESALALVDVKLIDHLVVADDDFVSFSDNGFFRK